MNDAARRVVSSGRYGDDTLLHVNRKELEGLEKIVGRPLTYNPQTGLPEAFGWQNIIPIVAGIAGTVLSAGNPLVGAAASGLASGAVSAAEGESMETALTKGLVSGVTSYAGGQLLSGVGEAVAGAPGSVTPNAIDAAGSIQAAEAITAANPGALPGSSSIPLTAQQPAPGFLDGAAANFDQGLTRVGNVMDNPGAAAEKFASNIYNSPRAAGIAALGTYAQGSGMLNEAGEPEIKRKEYDPSKYPEAQSRQGPVSYPGADYRPGIDPEFNYFPERRFAEGGIARMPTRNVPQYGEADNVVAEARAAMLGEHPARGEAMSRLRDRMGPDTVRSVREEGGRVRGAGGGLDDLVPGTIEGRQRVRLADGEYVISSDVVSALGDGSTDQGARKLSEMMDRVRKAKTGSTKQPGRTPRRVMPA